MPALSTQAATIADIAKRTNPSGDGIAPIVEMLSQTNEILTDMVFMEGNLPTGHRVTIRTGLPRVYWRAINQGVPPSKSTTAQVDETVGMLEARSHVDQKLADLNGNTASFRLSEDSAFLEAMNQQQAETMFYGNPGADPRQYLGLSPRYSDLVNSPNKINILDAGGQQTDNTSIWLVGWGDGSVFGTYPKGSQAGLHHEDLGLDDVQDALGGWYRAYKSLYQWDNGLVVKDWRYVVRIANIDVSNLVGETTPANLMKLMARAIDHLPSLGSVTPVFYMNRTVHSMMRIQAMTQTGNVLAIESGLNQFGKSHSWTSFDGIPLRRTDALLNTEARVV